MSDDRSSVPSMYAFHFWSRMALLCALGCGLGFLALRWVFWRDLGQSYAEAFHTLKNLDRFVIPALLLSLLLVLSVVSAAVSVFAVLASHRIAGPLFRMQRVGDHLSRLTLPGAIHLRNKDWIKTLSASVNEWVARKKAFRSESDAWAERADAALNEAKHAVGAGDAAAARAILSRCLEG